MAAKAALKLFVLRHTMIGASRFFLAKDERDLFERCDGLVCDEAIEEAFERIPGKRTDAAEKRAMAKLVREAIAKGSIEVYWKSFDNSDEHRGQITWKSYEVTEVAIEFLRKLGLLEGEEPAVETAA